MGEVSPDGKAPAVSIFPSSAFPCRKVRPSTMNTVRIVVRFLCLVSSVLSLSLMVTAEQRSTLSLFGFQLPLYSKWSLSDSFEYLVGVSGAVMVHSLVQLLISVLSLRRKALVRPSQTYAWLLYAGDQVLAYATVSAASAASGVTSFNRTGIKHSSLPNFCNPLHAFCNRVAASIAFSFFTSFFLATSILLHVFCLASF